MREINRILKFRAWNGKYMVATECGDWVSFDGVPYTEANRKYNTPNIEIEKAKDYVLMQFTGLLDKNGKEIYEGDILTYDDFTADKTILGRGKITGQVVWYESRAQFLPQEITQNHKGGHYISFWDMLENIEIIGNIYSKP